MTRKTNIIVSVVFVIIYLISLFMPIMSFSFGIEITGILGILANMSRLILVESYMDYLAVMGSIFTPILLLILIIWSFRKKLKLLPLSLLSIITLIGGLSWIFKYQGLEILLIGYYTWLLLILLVIAFNYYKYFKLQHNDQADTVSA